MSRRWLAPFPEIPWGSLAGGGLLAERNDGAELIDAASHDLEELAANLRDIARVNRLAGGISTVLSHLPGLVCRVPRGRPVAILDLATGGGDIPRAVAAWAARNGRPISLIVSDHSPAILDVARQSLAGVPDVTFLCGDARAVPLPDCSCDIVLCSLSLHHFSPANGVRVLREMDRLARAGFIVNDIRRCGAGYIAAWTASRIATRNRLTRHDMPLSVRRAYTPRELRALLVAAGLGDAAIFHHPLFRMAAVHVKVMGDGSDHPRT